MSLRDASPHRVAGVVVALAVVAAAALLNVPLSGSGELAAYDAATAAIGLADALPVLAAGGLAAGVGVGLAVGGLWAYSDEVAGR